MFVSDLDKAHPLNCLVVAQVRSDCADCTWFYDHGYIRYNDGTKLMLREHQRVALVAYGQTSGYHVHHIDRNPLNNRADNLAVLSPSEHHRLHASGPKVERVQVSCEYCGVLFVTTKRLRDVRHKRYCSDLCRSIACRKVIKPSAERLAQLLCDISNWSELARMFGVTDNAVRKWAKSYGLDLSVCDGRLKR